MLLFFFCLCPSIVKYQSILSTKLRPNHQPWCHFEFCIPKMVPWAPSQLTHHLHWQETFRKKPSRWWPSGKSLGLRGLLSLRSQVRTLWTLIWWPLEAYMVVNFRARGISRGARKLARTPTIIKKKKETFRKRTLQLKKKWPTGSFYPSWGIRYVLC